MRILISGWIEYDPNENKLERELDALTQTGMQISIITEVNEEVESAFEEHLSNAQEWRNEVLADGFEGVE